MKNQKQNRQAFTLIELLAVIAIIGVLAGLLFPAVQLGIRAAHRMRDTSAARGIVGVLIAEAMDNDGVFRAGKDPGDPNASGTSRDVFQGLLDDKRVDNPNVFMAEGSKAPDSLTLKDTNIGFQYIAGLRTTSSSRMPLVFTKGVGLSTENLNGDEFEAGTSAWESQGFVVGFVGGNATWLENRKSSKEGTIKLASVIMFEKTPGTVEVLK